jgi:hypothetical protein
MNNMSGRWSALRSHVHHRCWWNHTWALLICVDPAGRACILENLLGDNGMGFKPT